MADMGMRAQDLELKILEKLHVIEEKRFNQQRVRLEIARAYARIADYEQSVLDIDAQISGMDAADLEGLRAALKGELLNGSN